jgi:preprotein translocase subunit SecG
MGAAMGGGMAEAAFGADTSNVLTKSTINLTVVFFVLSFLVYLGQVYQHKHQGVTGGALPTIPASTLPAVPTAPGTAPAPATTHATTPAAGTTASPAATTPAATAPAPTTAPQNANK